LPVQAALTSSRSPSAHPRTLGLRALVSRHWFPGSDERLVRNSPRNQDATMPR
jgi:hypothetical protein